MARSDSETQERPRKKVKRSGPPPPKFLASSEKHIRDKAVSKMQSYLSGGANEAGTLSAEQEAKAWESTSAWKPDGRLSESEMAKIWAGLYYNFWMSDKPLVQQALADSLALLALCVRRSSSKAAGEDDCAKGSEADVFMASMTYMRAFWQTLSREWSSLDKHRIDKFYLLVRRFVHVQFLILSRAKWHPVALQEYKTTLTTHAGPLDVENDKVPASLCYHISDIVLDELEKSLAAPLDPSAAGEDARAVPKAVLDPFLHVLIRARDKTMYQRTLDNVFAPLLAADAQDNYPTLLKRLSEDKDDKKDALLEYLFDKASEKETNDVARKRLYAFCRRYDYPQ